MCYNTPSVEQGNDLIVKADMPGYSKDQVELDLRDDHLIISSTKSEESEQTEGSFKVRERSYGSFSRAVPLPTGTTAEDVKACMDKGVLTVTVPKQSKHSDRKHISIE
ncbi:hypothetical protein OIO90_005673 [Microbotryomycetes sp. JL221]|nr:hypothetical protein OIO90_005673 [Microbotryomycetes sp. JL221]